MGHALSLESTQQLRTWLLYGLTKTGKNPAPSPGSKEETLPSYPCRGKMTRRETCSGQGPALSTAGLWSLGSAGCGKWSLPTLTPDRCPASRVISQGGSETPWKEQGGNPFPRLLQEMLKATSLFPAYVEFRVRKGPWTWVTTVEGE